MNVVRVMLWRCEKCDEAFTIEWATSSQPTWCPFCGLITNTEVRPIEELHAMLDRLYFND